MTTMTKKSQQSLGLSDLKRSGPVECLGQTFPSDEARREHYLKLLAEKLKDPEFRRTPGFPKGSDEDILRLSDPPYYTACPNPFLPLALDSNGDSGSVRPPFATDVEEGKNDPIYNAHSYHTKVPPRAVAKFVSHYTTPGETVFDPFCGSGMSGVGCSADYIRQVQTAAGQDHDRTAILSDLSPSATLISSFTNGRYSEDALDRIDELLNEVERESGHLYDTKVAGSSGRAIYTVWSEVFSCGNCGAEINLWRHCVDSVAAKVLDSFICPKCAMELDKRKIERILITEYDGLLGRTIQRTKVEPVVVEIDGTGSRRSRLDIPSTDASAIAQVNYGDAPDAVPFEMLFKPGNWGDQWRDGYHTGVTHAHHFYTPRNFLVLSAIRSKAKSTPVFREALGLLVAIAQDTSRMARVKVGYYFKGGGGPFIPGLSGTLYIPSFSVEKYPIFSARNRLNTFRSSLSGSKRKHYFISTGCASGVPVPHASVDYAFVDPPFGDNLAYSELNFIPESWLRVFTAQSAEAIVSAAQGKSIASYGEAMTLGLRRIANALKPGSWATVEFSNTRASVWNALQVAIERSGLVVSTVIALDKKQHSFNAVTNPTSVKQDLVISAYKPSADSEAQATKLASQSESAWVFVREHLRHLPVFLEVGASGYPVAERTAHRLLDRMIAFHVQRMLPVPIDRSEFIANLPQQFPERDGMYFLPDQVGEYDRKRTSVKELRQLELFVSDEASATQWVRQQLDRKPQSFQDLQPQFMQHLQAWAKHEKTIELKEILALNFLCYEGNGPVPSQIHSYLSSNFKDLRNLEKDDAALKAKARDRWYVPDPSKEADLEKLRLRTLLKEFEDYRASTSRKLKQFRTEAVRAGFKHCYDSQDYQTIVDVAAKLPEQVIQEDEKLLMYFDVATMRLGKD